MRVNELTREQLTELKEYYYLQHNDHVSYGELLSIDNLVSDKEVFEEYENTNFVSDDFYCTAGKD